MKHILIGALGLVIGSLGGYWLAGATSEEVAQPTDMTAMDTSHTIHSHYGHSHTHSHETIAVAADSDIPSVSIMALPDEKDGYNLHITTEYFTFAPESVNESVVQNEGHAHIYVNGEKLARLYSNWFHLGAAELNPGENEIMVTLNANDHSEWAIGEQSITDTITVTQ